jgi:hypothetical protein
MNIFPHPFLALTQFTTEWVRLSSASSQLAVASVVTIGHRLPQFVEAAMGFPDAQAEVRRAASEKVSAAMDAQAAIGQAMYQASINLARPATAAQRFQAMADLTHATMAPAKRLATANAKRLTSQASRKRKG